MKRRRAIRWALFGCLGLLLLPCGFLGLWFAASAGSSTGSPALAAEWRDHLAKYADPEAARADDPEVILKRCKNGEWVFGRSKNSHGIWYRGGGAMVVRDSTGQTRAFFGHVCGEDYLGMGSYSECPSLAEFYKDLARTGFVEYPLQ